MKFIRTICAGINHNQTTTGRVAISLVPRQNGTISFLLLGSEFFLRCFWNWEKSDPPTSALQHGSLQGGASLLRERQRQKIGMITQGWVTSISVCTREGLNISCVHFIDNWICLPNRVVEDSCLAHVGDVKQILWFSFSWAGAYKDKVEGLSLCHFM